MTNDIVQIRGLPELKVKLTKFTPEVDRQSQVAMRASVDTVQGQVAARTPVNTGALRQGVLTSVHGNIIWGLQGRVHEVMPYGEVVEFGRKPGKPPPTGPIEFWVIRKGLAPAGPESRSAAFLIARAIGKRGTIEKAAHMFEKGFDASRPALDRIWNRVLGAALQNTRLS